MPMRAAGWTNRQPTIGRGRCCAQKGKTDVIKLKYTSVDSYGRGKWKTFKTLKCARKFAQYWVGKNPELGSCGY